MVPLISGQGYFTFHYKPTKHTQPRGWEKRTNNHGLGLTPSARREKFVTLLCSFLCICGLSRVCIWAKFPQAIRITDSSFHIGQPGLWILLSSLVAFFCWLPFSVLPWDLAFPHPLLVCWGILCTSPLCGFHTKTDKVSSDWPTPTQTNATYRAIHLHVAISSLQLVLEGGHIRFRWFHTCTENLGLPFFFYSFLMTEVILLWLADLEWVLRLKSLWGQLTIPIDFLSAFFSSFFPSLEILFITWTHHIMLH